MNLAGACQVCGGVLGRSLIAREMMYGTLAEFAYAECENCGCLQLRDRPNDMSAFYPTDYYSYQPPVCGGGHLLAVRRWLVGRRNAAVFGRAGGVWRLLAKIWPPSGPVLGPWADRLPELATSERILDVGCGAGHLLRQLANGRYQALVGLDPFLPTDIAPHRRVRLVKQSVEEYQDDPFDVVMLHHSLEHLPDQRAALEGVRRLLRPGGVCLVRVPVASGRPRLVYQADWVELDAPRHLFLHTRRSLGLLAVSCGLRVDRLWDDSDGMAYWGSELYRRGLSLYDTANKRAREPSDHFTYHEMELFRIQSEKDNELGVGGRTAFVLRRDDG